MDDLSGALMTLMNRGFFFFALLMLTLSNAYAEVRLTSEGGLPGRSFIQVIGRGEAFAAPDSATVRFSIRVERDSLRAAQIEVNSRVEFLTELIVGLGIPISNIEADNIFVNQQSGSSQFTASRRVRVLVRDLDLLDSVLASAEDSGITGIASVQFSLNDESELQNQARELAISDAKRKAREMAGAFDAELATIYRIDFDDSTFSNVDVVTGGGSVADNPSQISVRRSVKVIYLLRR